MYIFLYYLRSFIYLQINIALSEKGRVKFYKTYIHYCFVKIFSLPSHNMIQCSILGSQCCIVFEQIIDTGLATHGRTKYKMLNIYPLKPAFFLYDI